MKSTIKILTLNLLFFGLYSCEFKNERQDYADMLIEKVETFKKSNNRLPKDASELGLTKKWIVQRFIKLRLTQLIWSGMD